ncbi:MAG: sugar phosphorylase [Alkalispirochaeta sp.]
MDAHVKQLVDEIYPDHDGPAERVMEIVERYRSAVVEHRQQFSTSESTFPLGSGDSILISYGDSVRGNDETPPLRYLYRFLDELCEDTISGVHILPFSPYSSDDGFSVIDYRQIDPDLGSWEDVEAIAGEFRLMADLVLNHCSAKSAWFQGFLNGEAPYDTYFITVDPSTDLSMVVRPRALPLLTPFETVRGTEHVWTTFSADQVDLNWESPAVLLDMLDVFLSYLAHGAQVVRLDAIAYLWKEIGHSCIHHPNTHRMVKLFRRAMELVDPDSILITETNVPHQENISYFGDGDEAHMVYNFSLPPLLLDAVLREDTSHLQEWAGSLADPGEKASYFNFCASHDGIGLLPTHGILSDDERNAMIATVQERGGRISYKATADGKIPYEMNVNYLSAITDPVLPPGQRAEVFLASQAVMLALAGVPGIYIHSLIGSENWQEGVERTGANRAINREKLLYPGLEQELSREGSLRALVFEGYKNLLRARSGEAALHPKSPQRVIESDPHLFVILRGPFTDPAGDASTDDGPSGPETILGIHNLSSKIAEFRDRKDKYPWPETGVLRDLVTDDIVYPTAEGALFSIELEPYEVLWLKF